MNTPLELRNAQQARKDEILQNLFGVEGNAGLSVKLRTLSEGASLESRRPFFEAFGLPSYSGSGGDNVVYILTTTAATFSGFTCKTTTGYARAINWNDTLGAVAGTGSPTSLIAPVFLTAASPYNTTMLKRVAIIPCNAAGTASGEFTEINASLRDVFLPAGPELVKLDVGEICVSEFAIFPKLENLTLRGRALEHMPTPEQFPALKNVDILNGYRINTVSGVYQNLQTLLLNAPSLKYFFGEFPSLTSLRINTYYCEEFHGVFPLLTTFKQYSGSFLKTIARKTYVNAASLTTFAVNYAEVGYDGNKMEELELVTPSLTTLSVPGHSLPEIKGDLSSVTSLNVTNNNFSELPSGISNVQQLNFSGNNVEDISGDFPLLTILTVSNNPLVNLLVDAPNLVDIWANSCPQLKLFGGNYPKLRNAYMANTPFEAVTATLPELNILRLSNTELTSFDLGDILEPPFITSGPAPALEVSLKDSQALASVRISGFSFTGIQNPAVDVRNCNLSAESINQMFTDLAPANIVFEIPVRINVSGNPGAATCDPTIATAKGYIVITA